MSNLDRPKSWGDAISAAKTGVPIGPPSEEHKAKIAKSLMGRSISEEHKRKLSEANKGKRHSAETKAKISESKTGTKHSEKTKVKMSLAHMGREIPKNLFKNSG